MLKIIKLHISKIRFDYRLSVCHCFNRCMIHAGTTITLYNIRTHVLSHTVHFCSVQYTQHVVCNVV